MGFEIYSSILNSDYPMIVAVFTIMGFLTMIGYLVADILYAVVDPKFLTNKTMEQRFSFKKYAWQQFKKNKPALISFYF